SADPVRDLNNYFQRQHMTTQFSWVYQQEGPNHQVTHHATAKFRGVQIGYGRGTAIGVAKKEAAIQALQYIK
ncbi:hypothetical protein V8E53_013625, partial [Lactarius tabidus]